MRADFLNPTPGIARAARNGLAVVLLGVAPAVACLLIGVGLFTHSLGHAPLFDFHGGDWFAAKRILAGRTPYELDYLRHRADLIAQGAHPDPNIAVPAYPAPALLLMVPFGLLSYTAAAVVFLVLATLAALASLWVLGVRDWRCYGALFLSYPVIHGLALGALSSTLMLLTALTWRYRHRAALAGTFAAGAIVLKLFLWPLLAWLVIAGRTRSAVVAVAVSAVACIAGWAVIGFAGLTTYPEMLSLLSRTQERATYSVASLLAALGAASGPAQAAGAALGLALIAGAWRLTRGGGSESLVLALCLAASFAASPILWSHYYALLYVPIAIAAPRLRPIWLAPALLWPPADPASATWQIAVYIVAAVAVTAWVIVTVRRSFGPTVTGDVTVVSASQKWRNLGRAAGTGALLLAAAGLVVLSLVTGFGDHNYSDFHIFWRAGHDVLNGHNPYPLPAASELRAQNQFVYPAPAAVAMAPFALLPLPVSATLFLVISIACVGASLWITGVRDIRCFALAAGSLPVIQGVVMGTVTPVLMLLLAVAWSKRDSTRWIAGTAAAAIAIKLFVLPIGIWLVATRRLRATVSAVAASVVLLTAGWLIVGVHTMTTYPHLLSSLTTAEGSYGYALYALALRAGASAAVAKLVSVAAVAALAFLIFRAGREHDRSGFALAVVACLACSPIVWNHYFALLIVAIAVLRPRLSWLWALAPAFWLVPNANHPAPTWKIVGAQLACAIVVAVAVRDSARPGSADTAVEPAELDVEVLRVTHPGVPGTQPQAPR